jgi:hypothetical protein
MCCGVLCFKGGNMNDEPNLFSNVVNSENTMTELLLNFMKYQTFRKEFLNLFMNESSAQSVEYEHLSTQNRLPNNNGQPDFFIQNDEYEILIEIKTDDTDLTNKQPIGYLEYLKAIKKKNRQLVFLIPSWYQYRDKWVKRVDEYIGKKNVCTYIIEWESIIKIIESHDFLMFNQCFVEFLGLMKNWFETDIIIFNNAEVTLMYNEKSIPAILQKLFNIVDEVKAFNSKHSAKIKYNKTSGEYALYFHNDEEDILYFGVYFDFWEKHSKPLCFGIGDYYKKSYQKKFLKKHTDAIPFDYDGEKWFYGWIEDEVFLEENPIMKINKIIEEELLNLIEKD